MNFEGSKYDSNRTTADCAKRIRADIKASKRIPKGTKVSVRTKYFSGGSSIDIRITAFPLQFLNVWNVRHTGSVFQLLPGHKAYERYTPIMQRTLDELQNTVAAYKMDQSDSMTDYFCVNFYDSVTIDWRLEKAEEENLKIAG